MLRRRRSEATLDDVVELLNGLATKLMETAARIDEIYELVGGDDGYES